MKQRIITGAFIAVVYVLAILGAIYLNNLVFDAFVLFLMIAAGWEMCNCISNKTSPAIKLIVVVSALFSYAVFKIINVYEGVATALNGFVVAAIFISVLAFVICVFSKKHTVSNAVSTVFVIIYPVSVLSCFLALSHLPENMYAGAIIMAILSTCLADSMAYFVGSLLKGPKLCPNVSPKKTISGAIGGLVGGLIAGLLLFVAAKFNILRVEQFSDNNLVNIFNWLFIGLGSALFCEIGDLIASHIKRVCGIKDFGTLLSGHGGIMDRIDGLIVSSIYIYVYYSILIIVL